MNEYYEKQNEEQEKQSRLLNNKGRNEIARPNIAPTTPTYTTKAAKN
jgi:hypothetical protein